MKEKMSTLIYFLIVLSLISCENQTKKKQYLYVASSALFTTNETYDKDGYPDEYEWDNQKFVDESWIVIDQDKGKLNIYNNKGTETFSIIGGFNHDVPNGNSFSFYAKDRRNKKCMMSVSKIPSIGHVFIILRPNEPGKLYQVEYVDSEILNEELRKRFGTIPSN